MQLCNVSQKMFFSKWNITRKNANEYIMYVFINDIIMVITKMPSQYH